MTRWLALLLCLAAAPANAATFAILEEHMVGPGGCTPNAAGYFGVLGVVYTADQPVTVSGFYCDLRTNGPGVVEAAWVLVAKNAATVKTPATPAGGMNPVMCVNRQPIDIVWQQNATAFHLDPGDQAFVFWMNCGDQDALINLGAWVTTP